MFNFSYIFELVLVFNEMKHHKNDDIDRINKNIIILIT